MNALRRLVALAASLSVTASVALVLGGSVPQPASARTVDELCHQRTPVPAQALRRGSLARLGCSLTGRTVYAGRVAVVVPPAGMSVAGDGYGIHGDPIGLRVTNTGSAVRVWTGPRAAAATTSRSSAAKPSPGACKDRTFHLEHHHWVSPYRYRIRVSSVPQRWRRATVVRQIEAANANLRLGRNTCGRAHLRTPAAHYLGHTSARPDITPGSSRITCGDYDTRNVIGFGTLPGGLLGWTCYWWLNTGAMGAADIILDNGHRLSTNLPKHCTDRFDFEGIVTHEFGHAYGLAHTGPGHANLTMQHEAKPCSTYARTLGLGDWLGMRKLYGAR